MHNNYDFSLGGEGGEGGGDARGDVTRTIEGD